MDLTNQLNLAEQQIDYAYELVKQISDMNKGKYLEESLLDAEPTSFWNWN